MLCYTLPMDRPRAPLRGLASIIETFRQNEMLLILSSSVMVIMVGMSMIAPVLPLYGRSFGVSAAMVGLLVTSFGLARVVTNLPAGRVSDRIGRRPVLIAAPLVTTVGAVLAGFSTTFWLLVVARFIQGIGSAMLATAAMSTLADISTPDTRGRLMTIFQGSLLLGTSFGPGLGGLVAEYFGPRAVFFVYGALAFVMTFWIYSRVTETVTGTGSRAATAGAKRKAEAAPGRSTTWRMLTSLNFLAVSLVSFGIFFTRTGARTTIVPLVGAERLSLSESSIGVVLTVAAVFNVLALPVAGWGIDRLGRKRVIVPAMAITASSVFLFAIAPNPAVFFVAAAILGIGTGIAGPAPAAYVADLARGHNYGSTLGLFRTVSDIGFVIGPVLLGWIADHQSYAISLHMNVALLLIAGLIFAIIAQEVRIPQPAQRAATGGASAGPAHASREAGMSPRD